MNAKLDILATVREAYSGAWTNLGEMLRLIWVPGVLYLAISVAGAFVDPGRQLLLALVLELAGLFLWPIIAVAWHRFILIGDAPAGSFHIAFGRREARFLVISIFLFLLFVPGVTFVLAGESMTQTMTSSLLSFFGLLLMLVAIYFFVRLSLLLPAVSVNDPFNPRLILERTRGNFWRLTAVLVLVALPIVILGFLFGALAAGGTVLKVAVIAAFALVMVFFAVVNVAVLSVAYRELIGPAGTQPPDSGDDF
ncbi:MAG: hypothetical protein RH982_12675 [Parvibaculum sp.]